MPSPPKRRPTGPLVSAATDAIALRAARIYAAVARRTGWPFF